MTKQCRQHSDAEVIGAVRCAHEKTTELPGGVVRPDVVAEYTELSVAGAAARLRNLWEAGKLASGMTVDPVAMTEVRGYKIPDQTPDEPVDETVERGRIVP